ncbi:MAG: heavy metal translocating P-type ATPase [Dysgonamonadaceae bacterium]|jgi:Cu2+-exporting ATPase|nr:heavy metal translocating P-type ATPase [Dysgonamonadaceae bacterium]
MKINAHVLKMSCAGCAANVQNTLRQQKGVINADVNFASKTAAIEYDASLTNPQELQRTVSEAGYELITDSEDDEEESRERLSQIEGKLYKSLKIRTFTALSLAAVLVLLSMTALRNQPWTGYASFALATLVLFGCGSPFFADAFVQARHGRMNMNTLVSVSTTTAYLFSIFTLFRPQFWTSRGLEAGLYFETAGVLIAFILTGKLLEERAKRKTSASVGKLLGLQPKTAAVLLPDGSTVEKPVRAIDVQETVLVRAGEKIPLDGVLIEGHSFVDESMISGEPIAVEKQPGQPVFAGTINQQGSFWFRVTKRSAETLLSQIARLVEDAQNSKAPIQRTVDRISSIFVPSVVGIAVLAAALWLVFGGQNAVVHAFLAFVATLIIACPCALGLATPTAIMVGMGKAASKGVLIKDMDALEMLKKTDCVILDKTGTLTEGKPYISDYKWITAETEDLRNALFTIETASQHPLAKAITSVLPDAVLQSNLKVENIPGRGICGKIGNTAYCAGNRQMFTSAANLAEVSEWLENQENGGSTTVLFGTENQVMAVFAVSDALKTGAKQAVENLQKSGIEVVMATGDNEAAARNIARQSGINQVKANLLPEDKLLLIKQKQGEGKTVAMVGDGVNDSVALACADVGIAMGRGSDIAIETASVTLISGDLGKLGDAISISRGTVGTIRQNLFWAFIYNVVGIPVAAGALYPVCGFLLNPMIAGAAMAFSSVSVVLNSLRFKK